MERKKEKKISPRVRGALREVTLSWYTKTSARLNVHHNLTQSGSGV